MQAFSLGQSGLLHPLVKSSHLFGTRYHNGAAGSGAARAIRAAPRAIRAERRGALRVGDLAAEKCLGVGGLQRRSEIVALGEVAIHRAEFLELEFMFHPFGNHR